MKKKILWTAYNLDLGGIESSLLHLLKKLDKEDYEVTLVLEKKEGIFLEQLPKNIKVETYTVSNHKNVLFRKIKNRLHLWSWTIRHFHHYDFAACYATYSIPGSILARIASKNNALWIHSNYYEVYHHDIVKMKTFFQQRSVEKFKRLVFVSKEAKESFVKVFQELKDKAIVLNNQIDTKEVQTKAEEKITEKKPDTFLIVFVGRLEERAKKLSRMLECMQKLKEKYDITLWIIGDGEDRSFYEAKVKEFKMEKEVKFLGAKKNPYPYMKQADLIALTSDYEGFPVVCMEAMILKRPFLSTVSLSDKNISLEDYGYICNKDTKEIQKQIEKILEKKVEKKKTLDAKAYEQKLKEDLMKVIGGEDDDKI